jgi:hypothetical protein
MPAGPLVTVPVPVPMRRTWRVNGPPTATGVKVAVTRVSAFRVTRQGLGAPQPPPAKPPKIDAASGVAVSVTTVPAT